MRQTLTAAVLAAALAAFLPTARAQQQEPAQTNAISGPDRSFIEQAAIGGNTEIELGREAALKASNDDVKQFAQRMVSDHGKAGDELKAVGQKYGVPLPTAIDKSAEPVKQRLDASTGASFDKLYIEHEVQDHEKDVREFKQAQATTKNPDLKNWIDKTLPVIQDHLNQARQVAQKIGASGQS